MVVVVGVVVGVVWVRFETLLEVGRGGFCRGPPHSRAAATARPLTASSPASYHYYYYYLIVNYYSNYYYYYYY